MRRNILNKIAIVCCLVGFAACKSKKLTVIKRPTTADSAAAARLNSTREKLSAIQANQVMFNTFTGKAKTKLDINGKSNDVTLNIRINRDQKIWISITAIAGIEVARAQITPDSVQVINRLQSVYLKKPFSYINNFAGKQVNFKTVQALLVGNAIPELLNEHATITNEGSNTLLSGNMQDVMYKLLIGADLKVTQTNLSNQLARQTLQVANNVFIKEGNRVIPSQIDISSTAGDKRIQANLRYNTVEFDKPLEYPFSIPKSYEPAN
ncbi:DUF4292 domain-containing protein [Mucilaginibacter sp. 44-25]|uniref:DUF4292 domain-containing protein n=1 Tax=Mucilaginibacter sp. 44-25 TaxID=1895794 RepID=UPI00095D6BA1|nr:DUF4292 domain-containing protein [Mucilaginibacter sp. 44-25]OJW17628.1 MAG: hypothetical protein BGO48_08840 [Mucilaginibacter sp. 44-25]